MNWTRFRSRRSGLSILSWYSLEGLTSFIETISQDSQISRWIRKSNYQISVEWMRGTWTCSFVSYWLMYHYIVLHSVKQPLHFRTEENENFRTITAIFKRNVKDFFSGDLMIPTIVGILPHRILEIGSPLDHAESGKLPVSGPQICSFRNQSTTSLSFLGFPSAILAPAVCLNTRTLPRPPRFSACHIYLRLIPLLSCLQATKWPFQGSRYLLVSCLLMGSSIS
jgi:hypothetical protein